MTTGFNFALTQPQQQRKAQRQGQLVQRLLFDKVGAHAGQIALRQFGQSLVQQTSHRQVENGVTQKFKPFVVVN